MIWLLSAATQTQTFGLVPLVTAEADVVSPGSGDLLVLLELLNQDDWNSEQPRARAHAHARLLELERKVINVFKRGLNTLKPASHN